MEGPSAFSNMMRPGISCGSLDMQNSMRVQQQRPQPYQCSMVSPQQVQNSIPHGNMQEGNQPLVDSYNTDEGLTNYACNDSWVDFVGDVGGSIEAVGGKKDGLWHRIKWTEIMVKLLITVASYVRDDAFPESSASVRNSVVPSKKGKWRAISKVMVERGYNVSPQQCEDKFNDLNKKYKRLNDIFGRGTCCKVVENTLSLDLMNLSDQLKEEARKILSSKHLFYQEMCSYHNGNRLFLPHDRALQQSLLLALNGKDNFVSHVMLPALPAKRKKQGEEHEALDSFDTLAYLNCNLQSDSPTSFIPANANHVFTDKKEKEKSQNQSILSSSCQLEEQKLQLQAQLIELEIKQFKWMIASQQEDWELHKMRLENKCMKLENARLALKLRSREAADLN